ncbi:DMT family transporter [Desulfobaculum bizertense]|uniref:Permease of the drug/metabolite transporter (DMT) superfamily n=1 Tax=Desulfobaculum bizertense DSM 18034 TaxID=1121442 RepID=A0A1T4WGN6_9BACT|nr:EamA family transporter [Desulfobaculum bizertense]SKA76483.1 Permease of the drug/metabolite transporter (DMT) superfamily [Desulfobaculum bizertense DSM 18034]
MNSAKGYLYVFTAAVLWGITGPLAKYAFSLGIEPLEIAFWRCVIPFFPFAFQAIRGGSLTIAKNDIPLVGGFGLICIAAFYGVYQLAIQEGGAALACVLMYTSPAWVAIAARLFLKEKLTPVKLAAVCATLLGVAGVSGVLGGGSEVTGLALILGVLSGMTYAMYFIFGKLLLPRYTTPQLFIWGLPLGAVLLFPFVEFHDKTPYVWGAIFAICILSTYLAYTVYCAGLVHLEATRASIIATIEPVVASSMAFVWWGEHFSFAGYIGSALILGAVLLMILDGRKHQAPCTQS